MLARIRQRSSRLPGRARRDSLERSDPLIAARGGAGGRVVLALVHVVILASAMAAPPQAAPHADGDSKGSNSSQADKKAEEKGKTEEKPTEKAKRTREPAKNTAETKKPATSAKAVKPRGTAGPRVMTRSEMQKRSPFLEPPGMEGAVVDRYGPGAPDWSEIPPWRQTSFFGIRAPAGSSFMLSTAPRA